MSGFSSEGQAILLKLVLNGAGWTAAALMLNRIAVGLFFMLSGYHKLFNSNRHRLFAGELRKLKVPAVGINQWLVPLIEFAGGAAVTAGLLTPLAGLALLVVIMVAIATSGRARIIGSKPIDEADRLDDWLYLPETLYAFMLILVISTGGGPYSVDALVVAAIAERGG